MGNTYEDDMEEMNGGNSNREMLNKAIQNKMDGMELNTGFLNT